MRRPPLPLPPGLSPPCASARPVKLGFYFTPAVPVSGAFSWEAALPGQESSQEPAAVATQRATVGPFQQKPSHFRMLFSAHLSCFPVDWGSPVSGTSLLASASSHIEAVPGRSMACLHMLTASVSRGYLSAFFIVKVDDEFLFFVSSSI